MIQKEVNVGIIGTGHALRTIVPALSYSDGFRIQKISGSSISRASQYAKKFDLDVDPCSYQDLLESPDIDLIVVASPNHFHLSHAVGAIESGKNVYLEKPIGVDSTQAKKIRHAYNERPNDSLVVIGHQLRFNPFIQKSKELIDEGILGRIYSIEIRQKAGGLRSLDLEWNWQFDDEKGGGVRLAMGTHLLDLSNFLLNSSPGFTTCFCDPVISERNIDGEKRQVISSSFFSATMDYHDCQGYISTSAASHGPGYFDLEIFGTEGYISYDGGTDFRFLKENVVQTISEMESIRLDYLGRPGGTSMFRKSLSYISEELLRCISEKNSHIPNAATMDDAVKISELLDEGLGNYLTRLKPTRKGF